MKNLVKLVTVILAICLIATAFAGCEKKSKRLLYNVNLEDYVTL